jgi:aminoglycoside phosphotransferase (APT) family kinase protein
MREIAGLHAPLWGDPSLDQLDWLGLPPAENEQLAQMVAPVAGMFRERFESVLEPDIMAAIMRLVPLARPLLLQQAKIRTVLHGDFRLDNILFEPRAGALPMATLDWQTIGQGCGTQDASYFLGAGLRAWDRVAHEQDLLRIYHETLQAQGVQDYPWQQCWQDYRKHSLNGLFMAMFSAIVVARTDRGDDMFLTMARRHARQALELGGFDLWA